MTKLREKTRDELTAEIEDGKKKIQQYENREKMLHQKLSCEERKECSHRLIVRGAVFKSIVPQAKDMTDEEAAEQRMKELQKLIEQGKNYLAYKPIHDEHKQIRWKGKQEKYAEAHRAELTLWNAASRYLHARLSEGVKSLPISAWEKEYAELQNIRRCFDIVQRAEQPEQTQTKKHEQER